MGTRIAMARVVVSGAGLGSGTETWSGTEDGVCTGMLTGARVTGDADCHDDRCCDRERWHDLEQCRKSDRFCEYDQCGKSDWCRDCERCRDFEQCRDSELQQGPASSTEGQSIAGLSRDGAASCGTRGLARRTGDHGAVMAIRSLMASKVSGVDGSSTSSITWPVESNGTGLDGPTCGAEVDGAGSKVFGTVCSFLGCTPLAGSKGVGLGVRDPFLPYFWCRFCAGNGTSARSIALFQSPSAVPLLPLLPGHCAPMSSVSGLATPVWVAV
ncbi:hypothetical protein UY3_16347 [Chelonia mydas]|uniref:Uncharacterized protein n=1 Tax=Chelonia mydas TaxID=8469 RepID=M7BEB8_CHEMY|nr:hypothetical protein UY3_16347 [Chelonia mydas]